MKKKCMQECVCISLLVMCAIFKPPEEEVASDDRHALSGGRLPADQGRGRECILISGRSSAWRPAGGSK